MALHIVSHIDHKDELGVSSHIVSHIDHLHCITHNYISIELIVSSNNYNHIQENGKEDEKEGDHDEVGLHPVVLPLLPLPVVQVPSFRLRFTLVALVVVALVLVHLLEAIFPVLIDSWNATFVHHIPLLHL
jgi:hypothetical protein